MILLLSLYFVTVGSHTDGLLNVEVHLASLGYVICLGHITVLSLLCVAQFDLLMFY